MSASFAKSRQPDVAAMRARRKATPRTLGAWGLRISLYVSMLVVLVLILAPFAWLVISSVASQADLITVPLKWIPEHASLDRLAALILGSTTNDAAIGFRAAIVNSLVVVSSTTAIAMVTGVIAAYAFARLHFPGRNYLIYIFLATYMLPPIAIILPIYEFLSGFGLLDTRIALIVVYSSFVTPFVIWLMRGYFEHISTELDDAARVDGCSRLGALWRVILPVSLPGLFSTTVLAFLLCWDEFFYALILTQTNESKTLPIAINDFIGRHSVDFGMLAAGGLIAALPPVIIAFVFQRYIVSGLTAGGVKG
jgi:multiple sugar transport system permease protein